MKTVKRFIQGLVGAGVVMGLALNAAAAPGGGPGKGPRGERPPNGADHQHARGERGERGERGDHGDRGDRGGERGRRAQHQGVRPQVSVFELVTVTEALGS